MSVVIETTIGDITVDLFIKERPKECLNFLKLCKIKYYNFNLFHTIKRNFIAQTGDITGSGTKGQSIFSIIDQNDNKRFFLAEVNPKIKHKSLGLVSFVATNDGMIGSQFFITLSPNLTYLDDQKHCVFGLVVNGLPILDVLNNTICDETNRPYRDVRITHTIILDDPFLDPVGLQVPDKSPEKSEERLQNGRIPADAEIDDELTNKDLKELAEKIADNEAKTRATILEMIGDIPKADIAPPSNVLFVCKLNPVTKDDDLGIIFSRFGTVKSCEIVRDKKTGNSLQYAFVEFEDSEACEQAYFKMDNVLLDDRRIHVDFSQSVAKMKWKDKYRRYMNDKSERKSSKDYRQYHRSPSNNDQSKSRSRKHNYRHEKRSRTKSPNKHKKSKRDHSHERSKRRH